MTGLEPDELRRLLLEAVDPVRPSPDAYDRIRAGAIRRRRMRVPAMTFGGLALAGVIGLAYVMIEPRPSSTTVEPAPPLTGTPLVTTTARTPTSASGSGMHPGGGGQPSRGPGGSEPSPVLTDGSPGASPTGGGRPTVTPSNVNSPTLPPPASIPATAGDVDGDSVRDSPVLSGTTLTVTLSRLGPASVTLPEVTSPLRVSIIDVDADGYGELVVQVGAAGGTETFGIVELTATGQLRALVGTPLPLSAGLVGNRGTGFQCKSGKVVTVTGESGADGTFAITSTTWAFTGTGMQPDGSPASTTADGATARSLFTAGCGIA